MDNAWERFYEAKRGELREKTVDSSEILHKLKIQPNDVVLDIGCGVGAHLDDIAKITQNCVGIDASRMAIRYRRTNNIILGDMRKMPLKSSQFTKVFSMGAIEHVPETKSVLMEINRVTNTNAVIFITVPNKRSFFHISKLIRMRKKTWTLGYERSFYPDELVELLRQMGFKVMWYEITPQPLSFKCNVSSIIGNMIHFLDRLLNRINNKKFGFFIKLSFIKIKNEASPEKIHSI
jgi:2-polyprenyl-3-methyl-5-hydroxy-6-metoxy-1,4-benzoquinol methylase